ncbi:MAG: hypothetical protein LBB85_13015 [Dysgonamonadaceae bacterium]|nr:hypothetical protein [Dysgonamonadaceae bacterium]
MKDYSGAKYSNANVTSDRESVKQYDNLINLLPQQAKIKQENGKDYASSVYGTATTGLSENEQNTSNNEWTGVVGNNLNGIDNNVSTQTNHVQENYGVTGITGTGHTINIYQYPKSLEDFLMKILAERGNAL